MEIDVWNSSGKRLFFELPGRTLDHTIRPYAVLSATHEELPGCESATLSLFSDSGSTLYRGSARIEEDTGILRGEFPLEETLPELPSSATVQVSQRSFTVAIRPVRLWGKVEDFDGKPLPDSVLPLSRARPFGTEYDGGMWSVGVDGWYECHVPKGLYRRNHMMPGTYGRTSLESYFFDLNLQEDTRLDFRIGEAEVAKLAPTTVDEERSFAVRFICWTINDSCLPRYAALERGEEADPLDERFIPKLKAEEVELAVDDKPAEIIAFRSVPVQCMTRTVTPGWYAEATLPKGVSRGIHRLRVAIAHHTRTPGGKPVVERGEGLHFQLLYP